MDNDVKIPRARHRLRLDSGRFPPVSDVSGRSR